VRYPFTASSSVKVRPAIVVNAPHATQDAFVERWAAEAEDRIDAYERGATAVEAGRRGLRSNPARRDRMKIEFHDPAEDEPSAELWRPTA